MNVKPAIIVLSDSDSSLFEWVSDGWNYVGIQHTPKARALMKKAQSCIQTGKNSPEVIKLLKQAGFEIKYDTDGSIRKMSDDYLSRRL